MSLFSSKNGTKTCPGVGRPRPSMTTLSSIVTATAGDFDDVIVILNADTLGIARVKFSVGFWNRAVKCWDTTSHGAGVPVLEDTTCVEPEWVFCYPDFPVELRMDVPRSKHGDLSCRRSRNQCPSLQAGSYFSVEAPHGGLAVDVMAKRPPGWL